MPLEQRYCLFYPDFYVDPAHESRLVVFGRKRMDFLHTLNRGFQPLDFPEQRGDAWFFGCFHQNKSGCCLACFDDLGIDHDMRIAAMRC